MHCESSTLHKGGGPRVVVSTAAFHARVRGSVPGLGGLKETKMFLPHPSGKVSIVESLRDREVACSASDRQGSNFESCVWRTVSSQSSHHPQEVLLAQFSLYVYKGGLKSDSFHFISTPHNVLKYLLRGYLQFSKVQPLWRPPQPERDTGSILTLCWDSVGEDGPQCRQRWIQYLDSLHITFYDAIQTRWHF